MNSVTRDPLAVFDERLGVSMLKLHVPIESLGWNFYAIATLDGISNIDEIGAAARAEILIFNTEIAVSGAFRKDSPVRLGLDVSSAVWIFDVRAELALTHGLQTPFWAGDFVIDFENLVFETPRERSREDDWILQGVAGVEVEIPYNDLKDTLILGAEYFYNDTGYKTNKLYPWLATQGQFNPLYIGRHYVAFFAVLFGPGTWDETSFQLSGLGNLSDLSFLARFDYGVTFLRKLRFNAYITYHFGEQDGVFTFGQEGVEIPGRGEPGSISCWNSRGSLRSSRLRSSVARSGRSWRWAWVAGVVLEHRPPAQVRRP